MASAPLPTNLLRLDPRGGPAHRQIAQWLAGEIASGALAPGERLPAERVLAAALGVSRMTLRQALDALERDGQVTRMVGRTGGTFVARPKVELDLSRFAGFSEQLRRQGRVAGARVLEAVSEPASAKVAEALDLPSGEAAVCRVVRVRFADGEPLALERSWFPAARFPGLLDEDLSGSLYALLAERFGAAPHSALEQVESVAARRDEARALGIATGSALTLVERRSYAADGSAVEFARDRFRGDRAQMTVWIPRLRVVQDGASAASRSQSA